MVHTFRCLGRIFLLDVESGSIFEIDELTETLIEEMISPLANAKGDFSRYSRLEIAEAKAEIDALIKEGVLFSAMPAHPEPVYRGVVKALCLNIAHVCNLRCTYCFAGDGQYGGAGIMDKGTAINAIDFLIAKSGSRKQLEVDFFGGEPLLNMDVVRAVVDYAPAAAKKAGKEIRFTITTNAYSLTDELIAYFNEHMYNVVLSIDGRKLTHDRLRKNADGQGSFDKVLSNARRFAERRGDKSYYVRGTFTSENIDFGADAVALNDYGFGDISLEPVVLSDGDGLSLKSEHLPELCRQYEALAEEYLRRRQAGRRFNFFHFNIDIYNGPCAAKRLVGCNAGDEYLAVSPDGSIYPCHRFDGNKDYVIGNVNDGVFDDSLPRFFASTNLTKKEGCNECWAKYYCSGGCGANSILFCGDIKKPYEIGCVLMKKRVECALSINCIENNR